MSADPEEERLRKRLARKAELARASRRRKKLYIQDLEHKVKEMSRKIEELEFQAKRNKERDKSIPVFVSLEEKERQERQQNIFAQLSAIVANPDNISDDRIIELLNSSDQNTRARRRQILPFIQNVRSSLTPGLQTKFAIWLLDQEDDFYQKQGLWQKVNEFVQLNPAQFQQMRGIRNKVQRVRVQQQQCQAMMDEIEAKSISHFRRLNDHMKSIRNAMNPMQVAKFIDWVNKNQWCLQMLDSQLVGVPG